MAGPTNPHNARDEQPGCLRSLGTVVPITDTEGRIISDRLDNLIHASASHEEAEREIKLWFLPHDIPPLMRAYPTEVCEKHYYFCDGRLFNTYEPGSSFLVAPGDVVWKSDLEVLESCTQNKPTQTHLNAVVVKYLINKNGQDE
jgi:nucleoside-diphosphate kinase